MKLTCACEAWKKEKVSTFKLTLKLLLEETKKSN